MNLRRLAKRSGRLLAIASALLLAAGPAGGEPLQYVQDDAQLSGAQIHAFTDAGQDVTIVLGGFRLTAGGREITGRSAVLWIAADTSGGVTRHAITIYVEGDAKVREPGGAVTTDRVMLVRMYLQGRISAKGSLIKKPLKDYPLYERAKAFRRKAPTPATQPTPHEPPVLIVRESPPPEKPDRGPDDRPPQTPTTVAVAAEEPEVFQPVSFFAEQITSEPRGRERVIVARGKVYLAQGDPKSELFLEIRSQSAVVFTARRPQREDIRVPTTPKIGGVDSELPAESPDWKETVVAAYLAGDVVIARGERYLRGPEAFYDFTTDRAIMVDPVFRTRQKQRNIPVFIRADEVRALSARELWFRNAKVSTSDFYSPTYHVEAKTAYIMDNTPYDPTGMRVGERSWHAQMKHTTLNVRSLPVLYLPFQRGDFTEFHTPLRKVQVGGHGQFGFGVETEWYLFRLLGLVEPDGFKGRLELDYYDRGLMGGVNLKYVRKDYSGYAMAYGLIDRRGEDDFGETRKDIAAPSERGRLLLRHKHLLPNDWQLQAELSYLCDRNFLEQFFPTEFHSGKEQETLLYLKKQTEQWAFTALLKYRMNAFDTQTESVPDLGFFLLGQPLLKDTLTLFSASKAGFKRYRPGDQSGQTGTRIFPRLDTRNEVDLPLNLGPVNLVPYATGRATYWDDAPPNGAHWRPYGQVGARANLHVWRVFDNVESRLWDVHRLKHVLTPEAAVFLAGSGGVQPSDTFPMDPDIEQHLKRKSGVSLALHQRLQTKRGKPGSEHTVDWMRFSVSAGFYESAQSTLPADGRFFFSRPEYSLDRDHVNFDYLWNISDSTTFLFDTNYDWDRGNFRRINAGLAVRRDPRLAYFLGVRSLRDLNSTVGTVGASYRISRKYSISAFEQYDFDHSNGWNLASSVTITRKFPRWFVGATFAYAQANDELTFFLTFWPEGIPEFRFGSSHLDLLGSSLMN